MKKILRLIYSIWYGVKFENDYNYSLIKSQNLITIERCDNFMVSIGFERYTDVKSNLFSYYVWYRIKNSTLKKQFNFTNNQ